MHLIDWIVLFGILGGILAYGIWKTRGIKSSDEFLQGKKDLPWWTIGLSVMATQASAITFLSTPGQAYDEGMRFAQFYIGLPIAMIILCAFVLPIYYKSNIITAYQYLEERFDLRTRSLTAGLFLIQRGLAAGLTIFAPSIILSTILGWNLYMTNILIGALVILYTMSGGSAAVSQTQKQQMIIMLTGMFIALLYVIQQLPEGVSTHDAVVVASGMGKFNIIDWKFDLSNKYNMWSGILGGTFLFLSYFGTDQSQVQRYISGKSLTESRLGLLFNAIFKVPMQTGILFVGLMVFVFYQFNESPLHFNQANVDLIQKDIDYAENYDYLERQLSEVQHDKQLAIYSYIKEHRTNPSVSNAEMMALHDEELDIRHNARSLIEDYSEKNGQALVSEDTDYVFISFITNHLPIGLIGLLLAVIFAAAMSSTSAELNALATCTVVDFYERHWFPNQSDEHYLKAAKIITLLWGVMAIICASIVRLFDNLIEAVNIIGSLFYGVILGIFVCAFFIKKIKGREVFIAALLGEAGILYLFYLKQTDVITLPFLWLNAIGCLAVVFIAYTFSLLKIKK